MGFLTLSSCPCQARPALPHLAEHSLLLAPCRAPLQTLPPADPPTFSTIFVPMSYSPLQPCPCFFLLLLFFSPGLGPDPSLPHKTLNCPGQTDLGSSSSLSPSSRWVSASHPALRIPSAPPLRALSITRCSCWRSWRDPSPPATSFALYSPPPEPFPWRSGGRGQTPGAAQTISPTGVRGRSERQRCCGAIVRGTGRPLGA